MNVTIDTFVSIRDAVLQFAITIYNWFSEGVTIPFGLFLPSLHFNPFDFSFTWHEMPISLPPLINVIVPLIIGAVVARILFSVIRAILDGTPLL